MRILIFLPFVLTACASVAFTDPTEVTDEQISSYKYGIERGCKDNGLSKGDPPAKVESFCNCALDMLNKDLSKAQWQSAYYYSVKHSDKEMEVMGAEFKKIGTCRVTP